LNCSHNTDVRTFSAARHIHGCETAGTCESA
jgi:hypothetical protein